MPSQIGDGRQPVNVFIGFLLGQFTDHVATRFGRAPEERQSKQSLMST
jgi:hypothetical protein